MAPAAVLRASRKPRENQYIFDLGVKGRKTGLTLPDTGIRDENGLEPMDHLFSSPEKSAGRRRRANGNRRTEDATISSDDMEFGDSTVPEPTAVLNARQSMRMPPPRSKSPIKTFLQSPARRNPSLGPVSSPVRGSIVAPKTASVSASVRRKLDFSTSTEDLEANILESSEMNESPQKRAASSSKKATSRLMNGTNHPALKPSALSHEDENDDSEDTGDDAGLGNGEDSIQMINDDYDEDVEQVEDEQPEPEPEPQPAKKGRGRPKVKGKERAKEPTPEPEPEDEDEPEDQDEAESEPGRASNVVQKGRGKTRKDPPADEDVEEPPAKKTRRSLEGTEPAPNPAPKAKSSKSAKTTKDAPASKPKARSKRPKLAPIAEAESPDIQRGPPLPRNNRGLFIMRRETPMEGTAFKQTRYGRNSVKPVAWWKNERIEYSEDEAEDGNSKFLLSRIKEVVRNDEVEDTRPKRSNHRPNKKDKKRAAPEDDEDEEAEPWEADPGRVYNEVKQWDPADPVGAESLDEEQEVAWSSAAIITKDVAGASFKFAKCLSVPFFGAGIMDIPVGGMKKPKNSRKMQMVFFVFTGRVQVTINGGDPFRITKGGMWQVPRSNFYSIYNDADKPARIFFSQGCEPEELVVEGEE